MTVNTLELRSRIASAALSQGLMDKGFTVAGADVQSYRFTVHWDAVDTPRLASAIAAFLLRDWLYGFIEQRTAAVYSFLDEEEREYVALLTFHALRKQRDQHGECELPRALERVGRKEIRDMQKADLQQPKNVSVFADVSATIFDALCESLRQQQPLSVDAVVRFRLRDPLKGVEKAVDMVVDQFLSDREYEEFVSMLRYMLDQQPQRQQVLHVFCSDERVWICDAEGRLVRDEEVSTAAAVVSDGEEVNAEDLAMSILITRSPCRIVIHDITRTAPWPSFSETVERVFLERTDRCKHCSTCRKLEAAGLHLQPVRNSNDVTEIKFNSPLDSSFEVSFESSPDTAVSHPKTRSQTWLE